MGGSGCPYGLQEQKPLTVIFIRTVGTRYAIQTHKQRVTEYIIRFGVPM